MAEMLLNLPRKSEYVIAGRYPDRPRYDLKKEWADIRDKAKLKDVRLHDLRRTFGLEVARKAGLHVASKLLEHSSIRITKGSRKNKYHAPSPTRRPAGKARKGRIPGVFNR